MAEKRKWIFANLSERIMKLKSNTFGIYSGLRTRLPSTHPIAAVHESSGAPLLFCGVIVDPSCDSVGNDWTIESQPWRSHSTYADQSHPPMIGT